MSRSDEAADVIENQPRCRTAAGNRARCSRSAVWRQRRFGNQVLWNGSYDADGRSLGLSADAAPDQPTDTITCDSMVVLLELAESEPRSTQQMYLGATRARQHLVVIR